MSALGQPNLTNSTSRPTRTALWVILVWLLFAGALIVIVVGAIWLFGFSTSDHDHFRTHHTRASIATIDGMLKTYQLDNGTMPPSLEALVPKYTEKVPLDAWRHPFIYTLTSDGTITLLSLGADGEPGGTGDNADLWWQMSRSGSVTEGEGSPPPR